MDNYLCHRKGLEGISSEELQLNQLGFFYLNSVEEVSQSQLSTLHKVSYIPGHGGQGLIWFVQVLLRRMDSLLGRTNQICRKQAAGATHTPSSPLAESIRYL